MSKYVHFVIPGIPKGKGRHRTTKSGHTYTPKGTLEYEDRVGWEYRLQVGNVFFDTAISVEIAAYYPIPKSVTKGTREAMKENRVLPTKKPDVDNIAKIILDSLNYIAYKDDVQVVDCRIRKLYATAGNPRVSVNITEV